jgi:RNA polymerase sigma factor for flagellar operon FliA
MKRSKDTAIDKAQLIAETIPFATRLAKQFYSQRQHTLLDLEECISAALFGLCEAARNYQPKKNPVFKTFAYLRIRGAMYDIIRENGGIPRSMFPALITDDEPSKRSSYMMAGDVDELMSLSSLLGEFGIDLYRNSDTEDLALGYSNQMSPEEQSVLRATHSYIRDLLAKLPDAQAKVIECRYFRQMTFDQMTEAFDGTSKSWLSRLHGRALENLRGYIHEDHPHISVDALLAA